jgi:hypothetical protein
MPYKASAERRHKIPKARYRVTNWPDYDAALVRRGSLTLWVTEEALAAWHAPETGKRGGQPVYSDVAIETGLALRKVFHQPLRQTEGAMRSIIGLLGVDLAIPDHTTFMWTARVEQLLFFGFRWNAPYWHSTGLARSIDQWRSFNGPIAGWRLAVELSDRGYDSPADSTGCAPGGVWRSA